MTRARSPASDRQGEHWTSLPHRGAHLRYERAIRDISAHEFDRSVTSLRQVGRLSCVRLACNVVLKATDGLDVTVFQPGHLAIEILRFQTDRSLSCHAKS